MKIAWFTPFHERSAIAEYSRVVCEALARRCEIDIWTYTQTDTLSTNVNVRTFDNPGEILALLEGYDHCVYNFGNYHPYHAPILDVLRKRPGVAVLHDVLMHHFFMVEYLEEKCTPALYMDAMERSYGRAGRQVAERSVSGNGAPVWSTDEVARYPLFEPIVDLATAAFVHSHFHRSVVQQTYMGDVGVAYLPYRAEAPTIDRDTLCGRFGIPAGKALAVSTGIVHPIKRIDQVLAALARSPQLAQELAYVVIGDGPSDYQARLKTLIDECGLANSVFLLGYQPPEVLKGFLGGADFAINLRFPNSEGCSLSLIEQLAYSNPTIVIDSGMYREVPDDAAIKIPPTDKGRELGLALEKLTLDARRRKRMAAAAKRFSEEHFSVDAYCGSLLSFLGARAQRSLGPALSALREVSSILSEASFPVELGTSHAEPLIQELDAIVTRDDESTLPARRLSTIAIWLGFEHETPLHREGMTRFLCYLAKHLIEHHHIDCEVWCYSCNEASVRESFKSLLSDHEIASRIRILHERNCAGVSAGAPVRYGIPDVTVRKNNLYELANQFSQADCFLLGICYLDNALALSKPIFIPLHDLIVLEHYRGFVGENPGFRPYARKIRESVEQFNRRRAFFFCNSEHVRQGQLFKYIRNVDPSRTGVVYLPANVPPHIHARVPSEADLRTRFGITRPYYFYPTQIRRHKNVLTLLRAFRQLLDEGHDLQLVLTGSPEHVPAVASYIGEQQLGKRIVLARDIPEEVLYGLHAFAVATTVPTFFEGGFPWQAMEAMLMDTPAILSRIDAVTERVHAFKLDASGLALFDPLDVSALAAHMRRALIDRASMVQKQQGIRDELLRYQWRDVAKAYVERISAWLK